MAERGQSKNTPISPYSAKLLRLGKDSSRNMGDEREITLKAKAASFPIININ
jgi:hypothetical protein